MTKLYLTPGKSPVQEARSVRFSTGLSPRLSLGRKVLGVLTALLLTLAVNAQVTISYESFPNTFNTGFTAPINTTFTGDIGAWSAFGDNAKATCVVNNAFSQSAPNSLKMVNYNTSGLGSSSTARATSPAINLSGVGCTQKVDLVFSLYTYQVGASNSCYTFFVELSGDGGNTWSIAAQKTAAQLNADYGQGTWNDIYLGIPSSLFTSNFRYRFRTVQANNCANDTYIYIDNPCILNWPCATLSLGNRVWYDTNNDGLNTGDNGIANVTVRLYKDDNNDNAADGAAIATTTTDANGFYSFTGLSAGNYIVGVVTPTGYMSSSVNGGDPDNNINLDDNGQVTVGNETRGLAITLALGTEPDGTNTNTNDNITYDFGFLPDCNCTTSANNLLVNGNFENGTTGWSWSGGTLTTGTGYVACGAANGFNNWSTGTSRVWQDVNISAGATVTFRGFAGTHTPGLACAPKLSLIFLNASNGVISQSDAVITRDVDVNFSQLEQYVITAVAPAGTVKVRVQSSITCNTVKMDAFCLTSTAAPTGAIGNFVWGDANGNGLQDSGETGISGVTVQLFLDANNDCNADGAAIATATTDVNGAYNFTGLAAGNYLVVFPTIAGFFPSPANVGTNDNIDSDIDPNTGKVCGVSLTSGQVRTDVDAGYCPQTLGLGDRVYYDINNNGFREDAEIGISGATVNLYRDANNDNVADGAAIATTTTDGGGFYRFSNLLPGNYIVGVVTPAGYVRSSVNGGDPDNNTDRDNNGISLTGTEVRGLAITLTGGGENLESGNYNNTYDFGFYGTGSIGNFVWNDLNANGLQDSGEPGLSGVTVTLTYPGGATATATTDLNGGYLFSGLAPGNYIVSFPPNIAGFTPTPSNVGSNDAIDSDADASGNVTVTLGAGENNLTIDAGYCPTTLVLGNLVWRDDNNDGLKGSGEPVLGTVTVNLYKDNDNNNIPDGAAIGTTTTNASGIYQFANLVPGNYIVGVVIPAGMAPSTVNGGDPDNDTDNDNNGVTVVGTEVRSRAITLVGNNEPLVAVDGDGNNGNQTLDFGFRSDAKLGNYVWNDVNGNGVQDGTEAGVSNITVTLYNSAGAPIGTTVTDANGFYQFTGLQPGTYSVGFTKPSTYVFTGKDLGGNDNTDSDADPVTGRTATVTLAFGETNNTLDAGIRLSNLASVGNFVWNDQDNDGIQDSGEPGIPNVTVRLFNAATNTQVGTTTTDQFGFYQFTGLAAGTYFVVVTKPAGFNFSPADQGTNDAIDSDVNTNGITKPFVLLAGENNTTIDAGLNQPTAGTAKLGNYIWRDEDGDGIQDTNENGIGGIIVTLYDAAGSAIATTTTNSAGFYQFTGLSAGSYSIGISNLPPLYTVSPRDATGDALDSDIDPATFRSGSVTLVAGQVFNDLDGGVVPPGGGGLPAGLGDRVFFDMNNNGIDDGEPGVPGITVTLFNSGGTAIATAITDQNGFYIFDNLNAGSYTVGFSGIPSSYVFTTRDQTAGGGTDANDSDADPATGRTGTVGLLAGDYNLDVDAGIRPIRASLGGLVWNDSNKNGVYEPGETLVNGVIVTLFDAATNLPVGTPFITGADGTYLFTNLNAGNYYVRFTNIPSGFFFVPRDLGGDDNIDSDADPANGRTTFVVLPPGGFNKTLFAGISNSTLAANVISFKAVLGANKQVMLDWTATNEQNMVSYEVERSLDGQNFDKLGSVAARGGNSNSYTYPDDVNGITANVIYYRIKLIDRTGSKFTQVVLVRLNGFGKPGISIAPNPATTFTGVRISTQKNGMAQIRIVDMSGRLVFIKNEKVAAGVNTISIYNLDRLASGNYNVQVVLDGEVHTEKLLISK